MNIQEYSKYFFVIYIVIIIAIVALYKLTKHATKAVKEDGWDDIIFALIFFIGLVLGAISVAYFFFIPEALSGFYNPEYWALKQIISNIKG